MPSTVEQRVVQMRIDNEQFESGAKKTIDTLEQLKKKSDFNDIQNKVNNFSTNQMSDAIDKVKVSFDALEVVGKRVLENLTDSMYGFVTRTVKQLTVEPVAEGFKKFGQKTEAVATLAGQGYQLSVINEQLENLMTFADETSYSFTDMVSNITKFTATGQDLEPSVRAMEGIALWAATAGQNAATASRAMYQLSQAMSKGALKYDDYKSIQNASMDTIQFRQKAADTAVELGYLTKAVDDYGNAIYTTTDKTAKAKQEFDLAGLFSSDALSRTMWFSSDVMMDTFDAYSAGMQEVLDYMDEYQAATGEAKLFKEAIEEIEEEAYKYAMENGVSMDEALAANGRSFDMFALQAAKAGQQTRTWGDVLDATLDAVSSGWMRTFELIFGTQRTATEFFSNMVEGFWEIFAGTSEARNEVLGEALNDNLTKLTDHLGEAGISAESLEATIAELATDAGINVDPMIEHFGTLTEAIKQGELSVDFLREAIEKLKGGGVKEAVDPEKVTNDIIDLARNVNHLSAVERAEAAAQYGLTERQLNIIDANMRNLNGAYRDEVVQKLINGWMEEAGTLDMLSESVEGAGEAIEGLDDEYINELLEGIENGEISAGELLRNSLLNIPEIVLGPLRAMRGAFGEVFGGDIADGIRSLVVHFYTLTESLKLSEDATAGLQKIFEGLFRILKPVITVIKTVGGLAFGAISVIGQVIDRALSLIGGSEELTEEFDNANGVLGKAKVILKPISGYIDKIKDALSGVWSYIQPIWDRISSSPIVQSAIGMLSSAVGDLGTAFQSLVDAVSGTEINFTSIKDTFSKIAQVFEFLFTSLFGDPTQLKERISKTFDTIIQVVSEKANEIDWEKVLSAAKAGLLAAIVMKISSLLTSLKDLADEAKGWSESLQYPFVEFGNAIKRMSKAGSILIIALAVSALAASIWLLCRVDQDKFFNVALTLGILMAILAKIAKNANGMFANNNFEGIKANIKVIPTLMGVLIGVAALILATVYAFKQIQNIGLDTIWVPLITIATMMGIAVLALFAVSKYADQLNASTATTLLSIAAMFVAIGYSVAEIGKVKPGSAIIALLGMIGIVAAIALVLRMTSKISKEQIDQLGTMFLKFGASMLLIGLAAKIMNGAGKGVVGAIGIMITMLVAMTLFTLVMSQIKTDGIEKVAAAMLILSAAILVITPALMLLSLMNPVRVMAAALAISLITIALAVALERLQDSKPGTIIAVAAAFILVSVGIGILVASIMALTTFMLVLAYTVPWNDILEKSDGMLKVFGKFALAGLMMLPLAIAALLLGAGIMFFGIGCVTAAAGVGIFTLNIFLFAASIYLIAAAVPKIGEALTALVDLILNRADEIMMVTLFIMGMIAMAMVMKKAEVAAAAANVVVEILNTIATLGPKLIPVVASILGVLLSAILNFISPITEFLIVAIINLLNGLSGSLRAHEADLIGAFNAVVGVLVEIAMKVIAQQIPMLAKFLLLCIKNFLPGIAALIDMIPGAKSIDEMIEGINADMKDNEKKVESIIDEVFMDENHKKDVKVDAKVDTNISDGTTTDNTSRPTPPRSHGSPRTQTVEVPTETSESTVGTAPVPTADPEATKASADASVADYVEEMKASASEQDVDIMGLVTGGGIDSGTAAEKMGAIANGGFDLSSLTSQLGGVGTDGSNSLIDNFKSTLTNRGGEITSSLTGLFDQTKTMAGTSGTESGNEFTTNTAAGIVDKKGDVEKAASNLSSSASSGMGNTYSKGYSGGYNFASGFSAGVNALLPSIADIAAKMVQEAIDAANAAAHSSSPSRVMIESGKWFDQGFAIGIAKETSTVVSAAKKMVTAPIDLINDSLTQVALLADKDFDIQPTITPVVDMTNITAASGAIGEFLATDPMSMGLNQTISHSIDGITSAAITNNRNYTNELRQLVDLNKELLDSSRAGGSVYLNDGVIAGMVNRRLGVL